MKNKTIKIFFLAVFFLLFLSVAPARAEEQKTIHLKVAALGEILFNDNFVVQACPDSEDGESETVNAWCAVEQIAANKGWAISSVWFPFGIMLNGLGQYDGADGNYWLWFSGLEPGQTALNQHVLTEGENLLLTYGTSPLKISASDNSPLINSTTTISAFYFDTLSWQWAAAEDVIFRVNGVEILDGDGTYELWTLTTAPYIINAKKTGYLESGSVSITARLPSKDIKLKIAAPGSILFDNSLSVSACETNPGSGIFTINGYCALQQSGILTDWSWWGDDAFLNSLGEYINNDDGNGIYNGIYWQWFGDLEYGQTALNKHELQEGENLLLTYGMNPLRISAAILSPYVNSTTTITAEEFGLDANWMPIWRAAASSTMVINSEPDIFSASGVYDLFIATTTSYTIFAKKDGCVKSPLLLVVPMADNSQENDNQSGDNDNSGNNNSNGSISGGGGTGIVQEPIIAKKLDVNKAVEFLALKQKQDGSFGSPLYTDWSAIALASFDKNISASQKVKEYLLSDQNPLAGLNAVSDYARRAMALMSFNINPYFGVPTNYIKKITDSFDGQQFGDPNLFNDDIFALLVLSKAGFSSADDSVKKSVQFVLSNQGANGSFQSSDLTAAVIQALAPFSSQEGVSQAIQKARNYLFSLQSPDGGFGNSFSTSWIMQAIFSLGEKEEDWVKNNKIPGSYLFAQQSSDGGLDKDSPESSRIWATAYAIPAALGKPWSNIMSSFAKEFFENKIGAKNSDSNNSAEIATTTQMSDIKIIATSTLDSLSPIIAAQENIEEKSISENSATLQAGRQIIPLSDSKLSVERKSQNPPDLKNKKQQAGNNQEKNANKKEVQPEPEIKGSINRSFLADLVVNAKGAFRLLSSIFNFLASLIFRALNRG